MTVVNNAIIKAGRKGSLVITVEQTLCRGKILL